MPLDSFQLPFAHVPLKLLKSMLDQGRMEPHTYFCDSSCHFHVAGQILQQLRYLRHKIQQVCLILACFLL